MSPPCISCGPLVVGVAVFALMVVPDVPVVPADPAVAADWFRRCAIRDILFVRIKLKLLFILVGGVVDFDATAEEACLFSSVWRVTLVCCRFVRSPLLLLLLLEFA